MSVERQIHDYIVMNFLFGTNAETLNPDTSFLDMGIIDSTGVLEIIMFIEDTLGIKMKDSEMLPENLDSINSIARFVKARRAA